jgi:hypothetical protein
MSTARPTTLGFTAALLSPATSHHSSRPPRASQPAPTGARGVPARPRRRPCRADHRAHADGLLRRPFTTLDGALAAGAVPDLDDGAVVPAPLYLLALVAPSVPPPVLRAHAGTLLGLPLDGHAPALRSALDRAQLEAPPTRQAFGACLARTRDAQPEVRRRAAELVRAVLAAPPAGNVSSLRRRCRPRVGVTLPHTTCLSPVMHRRPLRRSLRRRVAHAAARSPAPSHAFTLPSSTSPSSLSVFPSLTIHLLYHPLYALCLPPGLCTLLYKSLLYQAMYTLQVFAHAGEDRRAGPPCRPFWAMSRASTGSGRGAQFLVPK